MPRAWWLAGGIGMIYRALIGIGLFTIGYYLGLQVGRAQALQEQLRYARESGRSTNLGQIATVKTPPAGVLSFSRPVPSTAG